MELDLREWLEPDGLGGFASGTVCGVRTRRYHALLLAAATPPTGRAVLVNGFDAELVTPAGAVALSTQRYRPGVLAPDGAARIRGFAREPWPTWRFALPGEAELVQELFVAHGGSRAVLRWRLAAGALPGAQLVVRPFLSGRDYHALHRENSGFDFTAHGEEPGRWRFQPYPGLPPVHVHANASFEPARDWYRGFLYAAEQERGLDAEEDLACPGAFRFDLDAGAAVLVLETGDPGERRDESAPARGERLAKAEEARRAAFPSALHRAADAYLVRRGAGRTIVAGYPWFTDWGRDTFIALRGLCLATGRLDDARAILLEWAGAVSEGMLPNRFPDAGAAPEYNAVDASLWFAVCVGELLERGVASRTEAATLREAVIAILRGHVGGTRYGIRLDGDGLLRAGAPGTQLTWMDARVGERVITPRHGKPVEVQALWIHALRAAAGWSDYWAHLAERAHAAFLARFWDEGRGWLLDVADPDDATLRPNQILAVGGLPTSLLPPVAARRVVDAVEARLWTPLGLRSLAPGHPDYAGRYEGGPDRRDAVYHQGTAWAWLLGPFVEAWVRARGDGSAARREARERFLRPLHAHLEQAGLGHVSEIADGDPPHAPRGCPWQAWSLGELLRLEEEVLRAR